MQRETPSLRKAGPYVIGWYYLIMFLILKWYRFRMTYNHKILLTLCYLTFVRY